MNQCMRGKLAGLFIALLTGLTAVSGYATEKVVYFHNDHLGSPVVATNSQGQVVWRESYQPYGKREVKQGDNQNSLWYTGKHEESNFGLSYFGARWYNAELGRFVSMDPVGVSPGNPYSFNRYAYANQNPYRFVDPDGRAIQLAPIFVALALEGINLIIEANSEPPEGCGGDCVVSSGFGIPGPFGGSAARTTGNLIVKEAEGIVPKSADTFKFGDDVVQQIAQQHHQAGFQHLKQFMSPAEIKAYLADPAKGQRFLGTAVHRATDASLQKQFPGRFDYNATWPFDFIDKATGQAIELTTKKGVTTHQNRGANIVTYD